MSFLAACLPLFGGVLVAGPFSEKIDRVEFVGTPLSDVVHYLHERSRELDPTRRGLNFVIDPEVDETIEVTLKLVNVTLGETMLCVVEQANLDYRMEPHACVILQPGKGMLATPKLWSARESSGFAPAVAARNCRLNRIEMDETPIASVVAGLAERSQADAGKGAGLNLVLNRRIDPDLPVTMTLEEVPVSTVLRYVAEMTGVEIRVEPHAIFLDPPGTAIIRQAKARAAEVAKRLAASVVRPPGVRNYIGDWIPDDPRSPAHPDYVHSNYPDVSKRSNALNNVYKWKGGKWTFVRYGSADTNTGSLDAAKGLGSKRSLGE